MDNNLLFVYGTLRKGHGNNRLLRGAGFVGEGTFQGKLYRSGWLPMATRSDNPEDRVVGEVYQIPTEEMWRQLDGLESHPDWYCREEVDVLMNGGAVLKAWVYLLTPEPDALQIHSGDYSNMELADLYA